MRSLVVVVFFVALYGGLPKGTASQTASVTESIQGRVLYPNGKIAPQALILAFKQGQMTGRILTGNADSQGRFVIAGMQIGIQYTLCASKQDEGHLDPYMLPFGLPTGGQCKTIVAGSVAEVDVVLAPKAGMIEGRLRSASDADLKGKVVVYRPLKFLRGEWVLVNPRDATWVPSAEATIGDNGNFKILGLPTGRYFLKVEVPGRKTWYFNNQLSDTSAQSILVQSGGSRNLVLNIP
jgi:hypothetical protein